MRKRCHRRVITPQPPRGLRPRLDAVQLRDLSICHHVNLDAVARGTADEQTLWDWCESVFAWSYAAEAIGAGVEEMNDQARLVSAVIERYGATQRIVFTGAEYQQAKLGVQVMDELAGRVDRHVAIDATRRARQKLDALSARCVARKSA